MFQDDESANTVLLIDDDAAMRDTVRRTLEGAGYRVMEAASGVAGVKIFATHRPRLVITDILMPEKDGIETVRELRRIDPAARIIAMSGGGDLTGTYFLQAAHEFGAMETIEKPFRRDALLQTVARILDGD